MMKAWNSGTPAYRRYLIRTMAFTVPYVAICVAMMTTEERVVEHHLDRAPREHHRDRPRAA